MSFIKKRYGIYCCMVVFMVLFSSCGNKRVHQESESYSPQIVAQCKIEFDNARQLQKAEKYDQAIDAFKQCLKYQSMQTRTRDSLSFYISNALLQLMNSYQACAKNKECTECFKNLYRHPTTIMMQRYHQRDICSIYAYSLYRSDDLGKADFFIQKALSTRYEISTHELLFRDYSFAAAIYYCIPKKQNLVMRYGLKALRESEYCANTSGAQWLSTMLANMYEHQGAIQKAINLHMLAIKIAKEKKDTLGEVHAYMALSGIYLEWSMPDYANDCASDAILKMKRLDRYPDIMASVIISKANALCVLARYDSMYIYLEKAKKYCKDLPYSNGMSSIDYMEGSTLVKTGTGNSLRKGIYLLRQVINQGEVDKPKAFYTLAQAYIKIGDNRKGEQMLDSMYNLLHASSEPTYIYGAYNFAFNHYLQMNDTHNIVKFGKELVAEHQFMNDQHTFKKLAELTVQINTEKKEQQLINYRMQAENDRLRLDIYIYVSLAVILLVIPILLYRRKVFRVQVMLMKERFSILNLQMQKEMKKYQLTKQQLEQIFSDKESCNNIDNLSAEIIKEKGVAEFKRHFELLHPHFLPQVIRNAKRLGPREELVCMLTALGQDNNQIGRLLFIAPRSVLMSKYRLKQKMQLSPDVNFETYIKDMILQNDKEDNDAQTSTGNKGE